MQRPDHSSVRIRLDPLPAESVDIDPQSIQVDGLAIPFFDFAHTRVQVLPILPHTNFHRGRHLQPRSRPEKMDD